MTTAIRRTVVALQRLSPATVLLLGYLSYALLGWIVLALPWAHEAPVAAIDSLFTAVSAMSTTGLGTVSTSGAFTLFGEIGILVLIQLGGVGYMTVGSFIILARGGRLSEFRQSVARAAFSLPEGFHPGAFVGHVMIYTLIVECLGAIALFFLFRHAGVEHALWPAIFHSVSAFCTAGFSLFDTSLEAFRHHPGINLVVAALSYLGAIGFIVALDAFRVVTGRSSRMTLTSKIILHTTLWLSVVGTALLMVTDDNLAELNATPRVLAAFFQTMAAITTVGFNTYPISQLQLAPVLILIILMIIGASPSGTGGGLKSTTFSTLFGAARSALRGQTQITFWHRPIPLHRVIAAFATVTLYLASLLGGCLLLLLIDNHRFEDVIFEATSALGTVGLSRGITGELGGLSKLVVIALMFVGRVGPLTLALMMVAQPAEPDARPTDVAI